MTTIILQQQLLAKTQQVISNNYALLNMAQQMDNPAEWIKRVVEVMNYKTKDNDTTKVQR